MLKQQGHDAGGMACLAYSPDGGTVATGGEDGKGAMLVADHVGIRKSGDNSTVFAVKLWSASTGFAFVTFSEHTAPVSGVLFTPNGKVRVFVTFKNYF